MSAINMQHTTHTHTTPSQQITDHRLQITDYRLQVTSTCAGYSHSQDQEPLVEHSFMAPHASDYCVGIGKPRASQNKYTYISHVLIILRVQGWFSDVKMLNCVTFCTVNGMHKVIGLQDVVQLEVGTFTLTFLTTQGKIATSNYPTWIWLLN